MPTEPTSREYVQIRSSQYTFDREGDVVEVVGRHGNYIGCRHPSNDNGVWPYPLDAVSPTSFTHSILAPREYNVYSPSVVSASDSLRGLTFSNLLVDEVVSNGSAVYMRTIDGVLPVSAASYTIQPGQLFYSSLASLEAEMNEAMFGVTKRKAKPYLSNQGDEAWY